MYTHLHNYAKQKQIQVMVKIYTTIYIINMPSVTFSQHSTFNS